MDLKWSKGTLRDGTPGLRVQDYSEYFSTQKHITLFECDVVAPGKYGWEGYIRVVCPNKFAFSVFLNDPDEPMDRYNYYLTYFDFACDVEKRTSATTFDSIQKLFRKNINADTLDKDMASLTIPFDNSPDLIFAYNIVKHTVLTISERINTK